jgi:hypothetical protein
LDIKPNESLAQFFKTRYPTAHVNDYLFLHPAFHLTAHGHVHVYDAYWVTANGSFDGSLTHTGLFWKSKHKVNPFAGLAFFVASAESIRQHHRMAKATGDSKTHGGTT